MAELNWIPFPVNAVLLLLIKTQIRFAEKITCTNVQTTILPLYQNKIRLAFLVDSYNT
jgi:hypothetical protein